jgi:hypothetical protein
MFKKTLIAAALFSSTSALAGEITIVGDSYKVGKEYLAAYTGTAGLSGDLQDASIGIQYRPGIALGLNNTLKFTFTGGSLKADTNLKLHVALGFADSASTATIVAAADTAVDAVADAAGTTQAELDVELAAAVAAAKAAIATAVASTDTTATAANAAIDLVTTTAGDAAGSAKTAVKAAYAAANLFPGAVPSGTEVAAELIDFEADGNGDYTSALFKIVSTTDPLAADAVLLFNDNEEVASASAGDGFSNVSLQFTTATIGAGDIKIALPEAKDDTSAPLNAPVAAAKTLVTTANQFTTVVTKAVDTIDVEQDRKFFADAISDDQTGTATIAITENTVGLGIDPATADFEITLSGNTQGVDKVYYNAAELAGVEATGTGLNLVGGTIPTNDLYITVDGTSNLETRTVEVAYKVTPTEADTGVIYLVGSATDSVDAFQWKLNGSEINFPYAPLAYDFIATNFEIANSGSDDAEVLLTAFDTAGTPYSESLPRLAEGGKLTAVSGEDIANLFNLDAGTKLSLTFTTSAPEANIKITGYSIVADGGGRMSLLSDAYEGQAAEIEAIKAVVDTINTNNPGTP